MSAALRLALAVEDLRAWHSARSHRARSHRAPQVPVSVAKDQRAGRGDCTAETLERLCAKAHELRRCVECGDALAASWAEGRCAACCDAVVARVEDQERDGGFDAWRRRSAWSGGAR